MSPSQRSRQFGKALLQGATVTWLPWLLARIAVGIAYEASKYRTTHHGAINGRGIVQTANGLMAFDASWYRSIAEFGYGASAPESLRFFPLFPLFARAFHFLFPVGWSLSTAIVANLASFLAAVVLYLLVKSDVGDKVVSLRSVWLLCLGPASFVLVLGYAEGLFLLVSIGIFLALRRQRYWLAALLGLLAGATRPIGVLLVVPAVVEVLTMWRRRPSNRSLGALSAVVAPLVGLVGFCTWCAVAFRNFWYPLSIQRESSHHGGFANPVGVVGHALNGLIHGHHVGTALHLAWIVVAGVLIVMAFRRLPRSYAWYSLAIVVVALSGSNLDSFERYVLSAFPLTIAAAMWLRSRAVATTVFIVTTVIMMGYAFLAFQGAYIP